jgi:2'-5' RNA ligase
VRAFVALEISDEVRSALERAQRGLARAPVKVKWVPARNLHVTMKFLGDIEPAQAEAVRAVLAEAAGGGPVPFVVEGLGAFPPRGRPRVLWAGVSEGSEAVSAVQAALEAGLRPLGFEAERRFVPHVTLGRVKSPRGAETLRAEMERIGGRRFGRCTATELVLFESTLTPMGAEYRAAERVRL